MPQEVYYIIKASIFTGLGHLSASHVDDSYLQGGDYDDCERNVRDTVELFDSLGFTVHPKKPSFVPTLNHLHGFYYRLNYNDSLSNL